MQVQVDKDLEGRSDGKKTQGGTQHTGTQRSKEPLTQH